MANTLLGKATIIPRGAYSAETEYYRLNLVTDSGNSYLYINPTPSTDVPLTDTTHWQQIASIGGQDLVDAAVAARDAAQGYAAQLAAGTASPAGTYANLAALIAADPDHSKIYITLDDGKWCYHNGTAFVAGGVYQSASDSAELVDIRVGADGKTYESAGSAVRGQISDLKSALSASGFSEINFISKKHVPSGNLTTTVTLVDGTPKLEDTNNFNCAVIQCNHGDQFVISGTGGSSAKLWLFVDENGIILTRAGTNASADKLILTVPYSAKWLVLHNSVSSTAKSYKDSSLDAINEKIDGINETLYYDDNPIIELGSIDSSGYNTSADNRVRTTGYININDFEEIVNSTSTSFSFRFFDSDYALNGTTGWLTNVLYDFNAYTAPSGTVYIRVVGRYNDDSTITNLASFASLLVINTHKSYISKNTERIQNIEETLFSIAPICMGFKQGNINYSTGVNEYNNNKRVSSNLLLPVESFAKITLQNNANYSLRYYDKNVAFISGMSTWKTTDLTQEDLIAMMPTSCKYVRVVGRYSNNSAVTDYLAFSEDLVVYCKSSASDDIYSFNTVLTTNKGNSSIVCAKEITNNAGNQPTIDYYLLEDAGGTNRFYKSKDLTDKEYLFTFTGNSYMYSFGILANGDVIAVLDASSIDWDDAGSVERSESFRKNPYVFLASENWSVQHEVDFGANLKPLGWLSNYGFRVLPNGTALFAEYTRYCVLTANVWKISGNPVNASNWTIVKQLELPDPGQNLLKHWHTVQHDPFTGIVYVATGDSNSGSFCFYSNDNGDTWTQLSVDGVDHSSKYFRFLNLIFTDDTIYWAKDWYDASEHYLFKCGRDSNGVLDIANVVDYIAIPEVENLSTYTTCYLPEIDAILLLEREDSGGGTNSPAPIRLCDLTNGTLHTIAYMKSAKNMREQIGFRTRYSEVYPKKCVISIGWGLMRQTNANNVNLLSWLGNEGLDSNYSSYGLTNVNNLWLEVYKNNSGYHLKVGTRLI